MAVVVLPIFICYCLLQQTLNIIDMKHICTIIHQVYIHIIHHSTPVHADLGILASLEILDLNQFLLFAECLISLLF